MPFAIFCCEKKRGGPLDPPCLDPMDIGVGDDIYPGQLLRRNRVGLFATREAANRELKRTFDMNRGAPWTKRFKFIVLECFEREESEAQDD
jgi:hypothetical protein